MTLHKQHLISNTSGLSIKPNGNYLFRFVIPDKLKSFFNRFEFKKTYRQDFYLLDIIKDVEHIKAQYKHIKKALLSNELSKDKKQELINKFLSENLNKDYEVNVIDLNNDAIQNKISVTRDMLNNTETIIKDTAKDLLSSIGLDINSLDKNKKKTLILKLKQVQINLFNQVIYLDNAPLKAKRKTISNDIKTDEPKIISVNTAMEMYQKYYEDTASTSPKTYFEKINALEYFKAVVGSYTSIKALKKSDITQEVIFRYIGVDVKGDIGICLPNTIAIKRPKNSEMKWQCFGSREHIPFKLKQFDKPVYVAFGMKEILLFELLQLNYLVFQSDSSVKKLDKNIIDILNSYKIILIPDNDLSCYKASMNFINKISPKNLSIITSFKNEKEDIVDYVFEHGLEKTKYLLEV